MENISSASRLDFFRATKSEHGEYIFDASCMPRPHFCLGLLLDGKAEFRDCTGSGESFMLYPGEIVFVPITTRYISHWQGNPDVQYISLHFSFDYPGIFTRHKNFKLQKFVPNDSKKLEEDFRFIYENGENSETNRLVSLSKFFEILSTILPKLETGKEKQMDSRLAGAIEYIEKHYSENITVDTLATECNMSPSRFYPSFKSALGVTPVDYLNHYRINRAIALLVNNDDMTVESISGEVGFESSTYFRRVFKRITGKNPKEYRGISAEI